ncbi:MAG: SURF1 family protein [Gemmatimonadota bacterium]
MSRRTWGFVLMAGLAAAGCVRLGFWQLSRLAERRTFNARLSARFAAPPVPIAALPSDTAESRYRRVQLAGTWDVAREVRLVSRTRNGSPGNHYVTPLRRPGTDTVVLVNRGWVYAQDAKTPADPARWRPRADSATGIAFVDVFPMGLPGAAGTAEDSAVIRRLDPPALRDRWPYPVAPFYLVLQPSVDDTTRDRDSTPVRLALPPMSEGPHLSYALQWFGFASVAVVGAALFARADRRRARASGDAAPRGAPGAA